MKRPSRMFSIGNARVDRVNTEDYMDSGSDSGLDVIDQQSVSSAWENSNEIDSSFSSPPVFKVPRLSLADISPSRVSSGDETRVAIVSQDQTDKECAELARLQLVLKALLRDAKTNDTTNSIKPQNAPETKTSEVTISKKHQTPLISSKTSKPSKNNDQKEIVSSTSAPNKAPKTLVSNQLSQRRGKTFSLYSPYPVKSSKNGSIELKILSEPEEQHRARYMTEGSRGAVKDRSGSGFPVVKLFGYEKPVTLQIFIGSDQGRTIPHLFYQASKACGKSSPPCRQRKIQGTVVIEVDLLPEKDMTESCDCVGILKERNVDVEQRLVYFGGTKVSKKRSPKCRLVFRVCVLIAGQTETLQVASQPILCTQPPGIPEISRQSLSSCSSKGGAELFIIGKNFLKDTKVVFRELSLKNSTNDQYESEDSFQGNPPSRNWQEIVQPDKDFLQPTHLICNVPPYKTDNTLTYPVKVEVLVQSSGKRSEPQYLTFYPHSNLTVFGKDNQTIVKNMDNSSSSSVIQMPMVAPKQELNDCSSSSCSISSPAPLKGPIFVVLPASSNQLQTTNNCAWKNDELTAQLPKQERRLSLVMLHQNTIEEVKIVQQAAEVLNLQNDQKQITINQLKQEVLNFQKDQLTINQEVMNMQESQLTINQINRVINMQKDQSQLAINQLNQDVLNMQKDQPQLNMSQLNQEVINMQKDQLAINRLSAEVMNMREDQTQLTINQEAALIGQIDQSKLVQDRINQEINLSLQKDQLTINQLNQEVINLQNMEHRDSVLIGQIDQSKLIQDRINREINLSLQKDHSTINQINMAQIVAQNSLTSEAVKDTIYEHENQSNLTNGYHSLSDENLIPINENIFQDIAAVASLQEPCFSRAMTTSIQALFPQQTSDAQMVIPVELQPVITTTSSPMSQQMINLKEVVNSMEAKNEDFNKSFGLSSTSIDKALEKCKAEQDLINELILQNTAELSNQVFLNSMAAKQVQSTSNQTILSMESLLNNETQGQQQQQGELLKSNVAIDSCLATDSTVNNLQFTQKDLNLFGNPGTSIDEMSSMMALLPDSEILNLINNHTFG